MEKGKHEVNKKDNCENEGKEKKNRKGKIILIILLLILFLICTIYLALYFGGLFDEKQEINHLLNSMEIDESLIQNNEIKVTERMLKVRELQKENPDIIGWLEVEDTNINYPVMQTDNNDFYMDHNYKKEANKQGSLFLDMEYDWNIPSSNLLIYGHNNTLDGSMFADLLKYQDKKFYKKHPNIQFTTADEDIHYEIVAAFLSRVYYKRETDVFRYYQFIHAENEEEYNDFIKNAKESSLYDTGKTAEYGEQLITLSTCAYHTEDGRFAVVARKAREDVIGDGDF